MIIRANLIAETGRRNNLIIPPRTSRAIPITKEGGFYKYDKENRTIVPKVTVSYFQVEPDLALRSIFGTCNLFTFGSIEESFDIILYNGGHESCFITHEQLLGRLVSLS